MCVKFTVEELCCEIDNNPDLKNPIYEAILIWVFYEFIPVIYNK